MNMSNLTPVQRVLMIIGLIAVILIGLRLIGPLLALVFNLLSCLLMVGILAFAVWFVYRLLTQDSEKAA